MRVPRDFWLRVPASWIAEPSSALPPNSRRRHDAAFADHYKVIERELGRRLTEAQLRAVADALESLGTPTPRR